MRNVVHQLLATDVALDKLGARGISADEAEQILHNRHVTARNPRGRGKEDKRVLLIGRTDGGHLITLVIERTIEPSTWVVVTGWDSTEVERKLLES